MNYARSKLVFPFLENDSFGPDAEGIYFGPYHNGKTSLSHPYSYDPFYVWRNNTKPNNSYYSDHLYSWDYEKHDELCQKHFGNQSQYWNRRNPEKIQDFLREYSGDLNLILCRVIEYCNKSNGYPVWRLDTFQ